MYMAYGTKRAYMPTSGGAIHVGRRQHIHGGGMGSVLLNKGGAGGGSSYSSIDDYIATTHNNPYASPPIVGGSIGKRSLLSMNKKIEGLLVKSNHKKEKNINFNI